ncbi:MAG: hypothetical protein MK132_17025 [Lentisphaerales bacterium]|nr:hypothetical protein [Lentisphaerales bacterium]
MKNRTAKEILTIVSALSRVAYSYDKSLKIYTLKTFEDYRDEIPLIEEPLIKNFRADSLTLKNIAKGLEDLYDSRIILSEGLEIEEDPISGSTFQSNTNTSNNRTSRSSSNSNNSLTLNSKRFNVNFNSTMNNALENIIATADDDQIQAAINKYINSIRKDEPDIYVTLNQEHSIISVRTEDNNAMEQISDYISANIQSVPQVLLEMKILELTIGDDFSSVFDYSIDDPLKNTATNLSGTGEDFLQINPGNTFSPDGIGFDRGQATLAYEFISGRVAARIELLKQDNLVETLATPILIATNNRIGEIKVVSNEVFVEGFEYEEAETDSNGNITNPATLTTEIRQEDVGLTLRIRPRINVDNTIALAIYQEDSSKITNGAKIPVSIAGVLQDQFIDIKSEKTISSTVIARDNTMIAIGGLVRTENSTAESKVPVLGDIPGLGFFFRDEVTTNVKKELVLLITPHIIYNSDKGKEKSQKLLKNISDHKFHNEGQNGVDKKNSNLEQYKNQTNDSIRDFIKDPVSTVEDND